jgi:hypothetical protein
MADDSAEHRDRSGQAGHEREMDQASRAAARRRIIITGLLTPPAVMTAKLDFGEGKQ